MDDTKFLIDADRGTREKGTEQGGMTREDVHPKQPLHLNPSPSSAPAVVFWTNEGNQVTTFPARPSKIQKGNPHLAAILILSLASVLLVAGSITLPVGLIIYLVNNFAKPVHIAGIVLLILAAITYAVGIYLCYKKSKVLIHEGYVVGSQAGQLNVICGATYNPSLQVEKSVHPPAYTP